MKKISLLALMLAVIFVAGCAAKAPSSTTSNVTATSNVTTTTLPPTTTTTISEFEIVATGVSAYFVGSDSVYFMTSEATDGKLMKASKDGKNKAEIAKGFGGATMLNLVDDSDYIYFTHELINGIGKFVRVAKADGKVEEIYSCNPSTKGRIYSVGEFIYLFPEKGTLCRMKKPILTSDGNFRVSTVSPGTNMVFDSKVAYFSDSIWIKKATITGKFEISTLVSEISQSNLVFDADNIFWINSAGNLNRIATAANSKVALLLSGVKSKDIASDGKSIFISNQASIDALIKTGGTPAVFAKTSDAAEKLAVDAGYLYWIEAGTLKRKKI